MKWLVRIGVPLVVFIGLVILDIFIFKWITDAIAQVAPENWMALIKIAVGFVEFIYTVGIIIAITSFSIAITMTLTDDIGKSKRKIAPWDR